MTRFRSLLRRAAACRDGMSSVEFAMLAPVFLTVIAGIADVGGILMARSSANAATAAAAVYVISHAERVSAEDAGSLARQAAAAASERLGGGSVSVTVNGGYSVRLAQGGYSVSGDPAAADLCYCPSTSGGRISFGSQLQCGAPCASGGYAGKFVEVSASRPWTPLFGGFGVVGEDGKVTVRAMAGVQ